MTMSSLGFTSTLCSQSRDQKILTPHSHERVDAGRSDRESQANKPPMIQRLSRSDTLLRTRYLHPERVYR